MILDASAALDVLLRIEPEAEWVTDRIAKGDALVAPHLIETEVVSGLRRRTLRGELTPRRGQRALRDFLALRIQKYPTSMLLERMYQLRDVLSAYDAAYVALAEALDVPLVTTDGRLARSSGHAARILCPA